MFVRKENLNSLDNLCISCKKTKIDYVEEAHLHIIYRVGTCTTCGYENHEEVKRI